MKNENNTVARGSLIVRAARLLVELGRLLAALARNGNAVLARLTLHVDKISR